MTYTSLYGPVLGRARVTSQVLGTLQKWIAYYVAEVERQQGVRARSIPLPGQVPWPQLAPMSYRGGLDMTPWQADALPLLIVVAKPTGDAEKVAASTYQQWYEVQIGAVVQGPDEPSAITLADQYGDALMLLVAQQGGFGTRVDADGSTVPFSERTELVHGADPSFPDPSKRMIVCSTVTVHTLVETLVDGSQGPRTPPADPYADPGQWPTVTSIDIQLQSKTMLGQIAASDGVNVTDSTGHVVVNE